MRNLVPCFLFTLLLLSQKCYSNDDLTIDEEEYEEEDLDFSTESVEEEPEVIKILYFLGAW